MEERPSHRTYYVLAAPALAVLSGGYLIVDGLVDIPDAFLFSLIATAVVIAGMVELAFVLADWVQRFEKDDASGTDERVARRDKP